MKFRLFIFIYSTFIFFGCNHTNKTDTSTGSANNTDTITTASATALSVDTLGLHDGEYALIVKIIEKDSTISIIADYIQYLKGQPAIEAAVRAHQADTFNTEDGKTHVGLLKSYFIANENKKLRRLQLDKNCSYELILHTDNPNRSPTIYENSLPALKKIYDNDTPFLLSFNKDGKIIKIKEVVLP